jgi:hypothetical protein
MRLLRSASLVAVLCFAATHHAADDFKLEPGFTLLFNGKDLTGWKTKEGSPLDGMKEAYKGRFKVDGGLLVIDPKVGGDKYLYTTKDLAGDLHIKFDFLPGETCNNDLFFRGLKFDIKKGDVKNIKFGEWNEFEIVAQDKQVEFRANGMTQRKGTAKMDKSTLGLRAELGPMQVRRVRVKEGK